MEIDKELYHMIFKRKSFRRFNDKLKLSKDELSDINEKINSLVPLIDNIEIKHRIVSRTETTCKRGEYCLLIYSEEKENFLLNIGYMFEQLDLYLASKDIGVCWYGMGKTNEAKYENLNFVIMLALGKAMPNEFRKDYTKCKRKPTNDIYTGSKELKEILEVAKYAPSACNTQPWRVVYEDKKLKVYRTTNIKSIMPKAKIPFYNSIDMGIFIYFLELTLKYTDIRFKRNVLRYEGQLDLLPIVKIIIEV